MKRFLLAVMLLAALPAWAEQAGSYRPVLNQPMPFDATSRPITTYNVAQFVKVLRLVCSQACFIAFGASGTTPVATAATGLFLPANTPEYFEARSNERIAVIRESANGTLYVTEMSK